MADFTMCKGDGCPTKWKIDCSRFRAVPAKVQSYMKAPFDHKEGYCEFYDQAI